MHARAAAGDPLATCFPTTYSPLPTPPADFTKGRAARPLSAAAAAWVDAKRAELRAVMWRGAGIVRRTADLRAALDDIAAIYVEVRIKRVTPDRYMPSIGQATLPWGAAQCHATCLLHLGLGQPVGRSAALRCT